MFSSFCLFAQEETKPYEVLAKSTDFTGEYLLDNIDPMYFDLYRSQDVDNTIIVTVDGQEMQILLLSANKMRAQGRRYNEGLVEKGAVMSGAAANQPRTFTWNVQEGSKVEDLTNY
jgi:hypothetical protein